MLIRPGVGRIKGTVGPNTPEQSKTMDKDGTTGRMSKAIEDQIKALQELNKRDEGNLR